MEHAQLMIAVMRKHHVPITHVQGVTIKRPQALCVVLNAAKMIAVPNRHHVL